MTTFPIFGGCLCGQVRYAVGGPARCVLHCHCSQCRLSHASLMGVSATIDRDLFRVTAGAQSLTSFEHPPGNHRKFCSACGSSLFYVSDDLPDILFYFPATLDGGAHPGHAEGAENHIYVASKAPWESVEPRLPRHDHGVDRSVLMGEVDRKQGGEGE